MKIILWLILALCLGLAGCTAGYYQPSQTAPYSYGAGPEPSSGAGVPPWFYDYDPVMRQWYTLPYINPYVQ